MHGEIKIRTYTKVRKNGKKVRWELKKMALASSRQDLEFEDRQRVLRIWVAGAVNRHCALDQLALIDRSYFVSPLGDLCDP